MSVRISEKFANAHFEYVGVDLYWRDIPLNGFRRGQRIYLQDPQGYVYCQIDGKRYKAHRIIWTLICGEIPDGFQVDHINRQRADNNIFNLRLATNSQNCQNKKKSGGTSKYKGVSWAKTQSKWLVQISKAPEKGRIRVGTYEDEEEAAKAYNEIAELMFGEFAVLNVIESANE